VAEASTATVAPPATAVLEVENLEVVYNRAVTAIQGVSLAVQPRSITAIVGRNGAGKTTTLQAIAGFMPADDVEVTRGEIRVEGELLRNKAPHEMSRHGVGLIPERIKIFERLKVDENLHACVAGGKGGGRVLMDLDDVYELFPRLHERKRVIAGYLSGGERQMLALAMGLLGTPRIVMIDEMSLGLSPAHSRILADTIVQLRDTFGLSFLVVEQNSALAVEFADYIYVMENGRVVIEGPTAEIAEQGDFKEFYLGIGEGTEVKTYRDVKEYRRKRRWFG
jgi:branched-chain amino acid transport system ATP-binding protein